MLKLMIASDIHGSAHYCRQLIEAFRREQAEKLVLLGDLLYHGPRNALPKEYSPKDVAAMLNEEKSRLLCVQGNCDSAVDQMVLDVPIMARYAVLYTGYRVIFATHGDIFNTDSLPPMNSGDILLHGHTHVPAWEPFGTDNLYLNPGSVSLPKENSVCGYMTITEKDCQWKEMDGTAYHKLTL